MFGKKVSEAEYNELEQKYLTFECAYNNEHAKCSDLENQVLELTDQIKKLKEAGNILPEDLVKRAEEAEAKASELAGLLEVEKSKNSDSGAYLQLLKGSELIQENYKQMYESALRELEDEKTKNAELTARLQTFSGGKTMANNNQVTQWEYKTLHHDLYDKDKDFERNLNNLGQNGWEAAGTFSTEMGTGTMVFKRPKQQNKESEYSYSR